MEAVDVLILGTGLTESITAAALSKAGLKVAHVDTNPYYGAKEASLTADELIQWAADLTSEDLGDTYMRSQKATFTSISISSSSLPQSRQYAISLAPSIIPSNGPLISSLISSGVARYGGYRLLDRVGVFTSGQVMNVPGSKEDIFKNKEISLMDKRRLMRFLMFAAGEFEDSKELAGKSEVPFTEFLGSTFSLPEELINVVAYALAFCIVDSELTLPALLRIRKYLRSAGRYGASPFLVGQYGGAGEIAQGFCRVAAVAGGIYILGKRITAVHTASQGLSSDPQATLEDSSASYKYIVELEDLSDKLVCNFIISSAELLPPALHPTENPIERPSSYTNVVTDIARCIAIIDQPIYFSPASVTTQSSQTEEGDISADRIDTALIAFPPSSLSKGSTTTSVHALITGEGSMSTPSGKWIVYLAMPLLCKTSVTPEVLLEPYLDAVLKLSAVAPSGPSTVPLFKLYYIQASPTLHLSDLALSDLNIFITPVVDPHPAETMDSAAIEAESLFWKVMAAFKCSKQQAETFWPVVNQKESSQEDW